MRRTGDRLRTPCTAGSPQLSWRRAASTSCRLSCPVISQPVGPPRPGLKVPDIRRTLLIRPTP